ncbi:MAG: VCBS repeat-containing protein [Bacteroidales bacterium]|nr:VCBS repeat-containing protein [Bacteroidales bacterium]
MVNQCHIIIAILIMFVSSCGEATKYRESTGESGSNLVLIKYNNPGMTTDLGVGLWAWPMPMDFDGDGDLDLIVSCPDKPYNGTYFFENPDGEVAMPVFLPPVRIGEGKINIVVSHVSGTPRVISVFQEYLNFKDSIYSSPKQVYPTGKMPEGIGSQRTKTMRYKDYNGDGAMDVIAGISDWGDYGWDNAFNGKGEWIQGPLHGHVYILINKGSTEFPEYAEPFQLEAGGEIIDVFGAPMPDLADFDGDGDLDLLCGEFLDGFNYFENIGTRKDPVYAASSRLKNQDGEIRMDLQMITPTSIDWDGDGDIDLVVGDEDGRVALIQNTGEVTGGMPQFLQPEYFKQEAELLKFGALATPVSADWDDDGDEDLICGNTAGYIGFIENLDGGDPPCWANPVYLEANGNIIRIQAGYNGSIQGPAEAKWGYTTLSVADWDHDGLRDLVVNSIWGKVVWFRNIGEKGRPSLAEAEALEVEWQVENPKPPWIWWDPEEKELVTQWRTTPYVIDWNKDGLNDLVMLDHEGYLAFFERFRDGDILKLAPGDRIFTGSDRDRDGNPIVDESGLLRLNKDLAGKSGRRKFCFADWDADEQPDLLVNSMNVNFLRNKGDSAGFARMELVGLVDPYRLAGHTTSPTTVDWNKDGLRDLLIGAEDGHFYFLQNPVTR